MVYFSRSPALIGCFIVDREYFQEIGLLDEGMEVYGGENVELGIRVRNITNQHWWLTLKIQLASYCRVKNSQKCMNYGIQRMQRDPQLCYKLYLVGGEGCKKKGKAKELSGTRIEIQNLLLFFHSSNSVRVL